MLIYGTAERQDLLCVRHIPKTMPKTEAYRTYMKTTSISTLTWNLHVNTQRGDWGHELGSGAV